MGVIDTIREVDPLADVLDLSRVRGALLASVRAAAPWGLDLPAGHRRALFTRSPRARPGCASTGKHRSSSCPATCCCFRAASGIGSRPLPTRAAARSTAR